MIAVIFEAEPHDACKDRYFDLAAELLPALSTADGFMSIERFESLTTPGKILSLSFWRDEAAVAAWRVSSSHRKAQMAGRKVVFADYRLRVARVIRDYGLHDRAAAPADSLAFHQKAAQDV